VPQQDYVQVLLQARSRGHAMSRSAVQRVLLALRQALKDLPEGDNNVITAAEARAMRARILGVIDGLSNATIEGTRRSVNVTVTDIVRLHARVNQRLLEEEGVITTGLMERFAAIPMRAIAAIGSRAATAATFKTVVNRHMEDAVPDLDRLLTAGIARGVASAKLAVDVEELLRGEYPSLQDYGIRMDELSGLRSISSDARMIALSETNNAMREATQMAMAASPIVQAAKWQTSGNHGTPDECDELAEADDFGFGAGFYPMESWPVAPHPNCGCYAGDVLFLPVSEWGPTSEE
jgi:surface antigen